MKHAIERIFISHTIIYFQLKLFIQIETLSYEHTRMILELLSGNLYIVEIGKIFKKTLEDSDENEKKNFFKVQCIHSFVFKFKLGAHV